MADIVLDDGNTIVTNSNGTTQSTQPSVPLQDKVVDKGIVKRDTTLSGMMTDRYNNPPSVEELQAFQNKLMNRPEGFAQLPQHEKERIMFDELQNWHFKDMPSIEQMKAELQENPISYEVTSLNKKDTYGLGNPHVNIKNENVKLTIVSDGKTITFNNKELMEQYRKNINEKELEKTKMPDIQKRGASTHNERVFND